MEVGELDDMRNYQFSSEDEQLNGAQNMVDVRPGQPATGGQVRLKKKAKRTKSDRGDGASGEASTAKEKTRQSDHINMRLYSQPRVGLPDSGLYSVVSPRTVGEAMTRIAKEVAAIIDVPPATAQLLLDYFKWDAERTVERYYEDSDAVLKTAHIAKPPVDDDPMTSGSTVCDICLCDIDGMDSRKAGCGHSFCLLCWKGHLTSRLTGGGSCSAVQCPASGCVMRLDSGFITDILTGDPVALARYQLGLVNDYVQVAKNMRWCPGKDCKGVIRLATPSSDWICISCPHCKETSCFVCGEPWHDPVLCQLLKRWLKKMQDDSETENWIATNTKDCPKCGVTIEKNGGCNQMSASAYSPHGCNKFEEKADKDASRAALLRYLFYETRYRIHDQSLKLETKLNDSVQCRMDELVAHDMTWVDVQFLKKAVDTLRRCRQTLMYTYAFAYHLQRNPQQEIFEQNQADLEQSTEKLSGFLEREVGRTARVDEMRRNVLDSMAYCDKRREILAQHVYEGYEAESWVFKV